MTTATAIPNIRVAQLERAIVARYGARRLPDDDEGRDILRPVLDHLAQIDPNRIRPWCATFAPTLPAATVDHMIADRKAIIAQCGKSALFWNKTALAHEIDLTDEERTKAKAWSIAAVDVDDEERAQRRKATRAAAARAKRAADGATPRAQSITATKPWLADGFATRRTWERHGKRPRVANSSPTTISSSMPVTCLRHDDSAPEIEQQPGAERDAPAKPSTPPRRTPSLNEAEGYSTLREWDRYHFEFLGRFRHVRTPRMKAWRNTQLAEINSKIDAERDRLAMAMEARQ